MVRELRPELPIIFGGWHPSLLHAARRCAKTFVDIVVRHQGEKTLVEILDRLEAGQPLDMVAGCWFKRDGTHSSESRPARRLRSRILPVARLRSGRFRCL